MVDVIKKTKITEIVNEKFIVQMSVEEYDKEIEDEVFSNQVRNVENYVEKKTGETGLTILDVRYKNNDMTSDIIEIESEKVTKTEKYI